MSYDIAEVTLTPSDSRETRIDIFMDGSGWVGFDYRETVKGAVTPVVRQIDYSNRYQVSASEVEQDDLVRALSEAGVFELTDEPMNEAAGYSAWLDVRAGEKDKRFHFYTRPTSGARQAVHQVIMEFARKMKVAPPDDLTSVTITSEGDRQPAVTVTLTELIRAPESYNGKRISVSGYFTNEFEGRSLCHDRSKKSDLCIWFGSFSTFANPADLERKDTGWLNAEGVFFKGPAGHLGMYSGVITRITKSVPAKAKGQF
ncbi:MULTISPECIES: hypothetical protein [Asticcacaulis]|uniref:hypothetical protein n=1 Tax=Asticcacaulis TaxID=76890 RepID=UPI001AE49F04|nr:MULTISPECIES: hypothetical protein [Asticcacaulis]MBP2157476.1 hypothetical protein [Asticcacaulis solisilvae]MDR6798521.1 hypothetical protein [Asticcacaulis sp. BE141]